MKMNGSSFIRSRCYFIKGIGNDVSVIFIDITSLKVRMMDQKKSSGLFRSEAVQAYLERLKTEPIIGEMIGIHLRLDSWIHEYRYANQKRHEYNMPPLDKTHYQLRAYRSVAIEFGHVITKYTEFSDDILIIIFDVIDELNSIDVDTSVAYQHLLKLNCDKPVCKQTVSDLAL